VRWGSVSNPYASNGSIDATANAAVSWSWPTATNALLSATSSIPHEMALPMASPGKSCTSTSSTQCSDAIVVDDEACDAGNDNPIDGCEWRAESLCAVLCQTLVRRTPGIQGPRQLASQLLINNDAVENIIMRKAKAVQLPSIIATSREQGMQALQTELVRLIKTGLVDELDRLAMARNKVGIEAPIAEKRASSPGAGKIDVAAVRRPTVLTGAQLHTPASSGSAGHRLVF